MDQHARGSGELHLNNQLKQCELTEKQYNDLRNNPESRIQFLLGCQYCAPIISIITSCPKEYGGMGGITGLNYRALEKRIKWATPDMFDYDYVEQLYEPVILSVAGSLISALNRKKANPSHGSPLFDLQYLK